MVIVGDKRLLWPLLAMIAASALFVAFPAIDIIVTGWFYNDAEFYWREAQPFAFLSDNVGILLGLLIAIPLLLSWHPRYRLTHRQRLYLILVMAVGGGLIVNEIFKNNWGRARPRQVIEFGGERHFTPAWIISDQCNRNCSFTSGDASVGFFLFAYVFLYRRYWKQWLSAAFALGGLLGLTRIVQGAHFLSDTVMTAFFMYFTAYALSRALLERQTTPDAL